MSVFLVPEEEEESYLNFASLREHCWPELVVHVLVTLLLCPTPTISYPFFGLRPQMEFSLSGMPFHLSSFLTFCYFNALFHFLSLCLSIAFPKCICVPSPSDSLSQSCEELHSAGFKICTHFTVFNMKSRWKKVLRSRQGTSSRVL